MIDKLFQKKVISSELPAEVGNNLRRVLRLQDLTSMGIAAIIGAGIFGTIGNASASGGPAVSLLFIFTSLTCLFSALCYAEFASSVPISGSAYTYAYVSYGEIIAWIIGWDLLMEYAIGNIAVAISWSDYFTSFLKGLGIHFPEFLSMDYFTAYKHSLSNEKIISGDNFFSAWHHAPEFLGIKIIFDLPAVMITLSITTLVYIGIKESISIGNILVVLKLTVVLLIIGVGIFYVQPSHWTPFAPNGIKGILKGVSSVFFAYIGFDAISTTAEECQNPKKDLPKAMIVSLLICTILYVAITLVLTGMVSYTELNIGDPLTYVFEKCGLHFLSGVIALSAIIAMASVLLVFQLGQPRIWMSMSRDGLLPPIFSKIHPKYKTPSFSTILTGLLVAIPAMFMNLTEVTDLCSIGTLFAFSLVCGGILIKKEQTKTKGNFYVPYYNSKYVFPLFFIMTLSAIIFLNPSTFNSFEIIRSTIAEEFSLTLFMISFLVLCILAHAKNLSLIPLLGLTSNLYLMSTMGWTNWSRFLLWLITGLIIYFIYGIKNSKLRKQVEHSYNNS